MILVFPASDISDVDNFYVPVGYYYVFSGDKSSQIFYLFFACYINASHSDSSRLSHE